LVELNGSKKLLKKGGEKKGGEKKGGEKKGGEKTSEQLKELCW